MIGTDTNVTKPGTIVPVAPELMRCAWFPQMTAEYVTKDQLRQLNLRNATFERDATFGIPQPVREKPEEVEEKASSLADLKLTLISVSTLGVPSSGTLLTLVVATRGHPASVRTPPF